MTKHSKAMNVLYNKYFNISTCVLLCLLSNFLLFSSILFTKSNSICLFDSYDIKIEENVWSFIKITNYVSIAISWSFISHSIFSKKQNKPNNIVKAYTNEPIANELHLYVGKEKDTSKDVIIPEKGLYQNILITGTIGTGKTSSAMYPFLEQLLEQNVGMLILDVKGNFHKKVLELNQKYKRKVIVIELKGKYKYNPLDKPNLKPSIIAHRLKTILMLFSNQQVTDTYWLDKVEIFLTECIKLCRLYNKNYVTFIEIHKLVNSPAYLQDKLDIVKNLFLSGTLSPSQIFDFNTCIDFFNNEYKTLDSKVLSIIQSEITRITQTFISDLDVSNAFCPPQSEVNFSGFSLNSNEIVVLNMNVAEYRNLAKIIATYLKLDFQAEVLMRLSKNETYSPLAFLCDEYHEYATENDADFYAQSREAKCISIVSTQSYTSLLKAVKDQQSAKVIIQNLVNKIWFRTDDNFTIEEAQKQLGKEDKTKVIRSISENAKETRYSHILKSFKSDNSSLSESLSAQIYHDYIYDFNSFSRELQTFQAICFISTGTQILPPTFTQLKPISQNNSYSLTQNFKITNENHPIHKLI